ncbi:MAG: hypothetical protein ACTSW3_09225 [Promethearchaeota archaeon]
MAILGGILLLISTYLLAFQVTGPFNVYDTTAWLKLTNLFTSSTTHWYDYLFAIIFVLFLLSGFLLLIGANKRGISIFSALIALLIGFYIFITIVSDILPYEAEVYVYSWFTSGELVPGILPFNIPVGNASLGLYLMLTGAVLGFIGGLMPRD